MAHNSADALAVRIGDADGDEDCVTPASSPRSSVDGASSPRSTDVEISSVHGDFGRNSGFAPVFAPVRRRSQPFDEINVTTSGVDGNPLPGRATSRVLYFSGRLVWCGLWRFGVARRSAVVLQI